MTLRAIEKPSCRRPTSSWSGCAGLAPDLRRIFTDGRMNGSLLEISCVNLCTTRRARRKARLLHGQPGRAAGANRALIITDKAHGAISRKDQIPLPARRPGRQRKPIGSPLVRQKLAALAAFLAAESGDQPPGRRNPTLTATKLRPRGRAGKFPLHAPPAGSLPSRGGRPARVR